MFCRNCGKDLTGTSEICANCGSHPVQATAFCRYCGNATNAQDLACPTCGSAIKKIVGNAKREPKYHPVLTALNILAIVLVVALYIWLALPPRIAKPVKAAASDAMLATTGYTSLPLHSISATPPMIPELQNVGQVFVPRGIFVNTTQQITVYAIYKNITSNNATKATRLEEVTANCTYQSNDSRVATITSVGLLKGVAPGSTNITISYTAVPGSANISSASQGKVPITVTVNVPVWVR